LSKVSRDYKLRSKLNHFPNSTDIGVHQPCCAACGIDQPLKLDSLDACGWQPPQAEECVVRPADCPQATQVRLPELNNELITP